MILHVTLLKWFPVTLRGGGGGGGGGGRRMDYFEDKIVENNKISLLYAEIFFMAMIFK